MTSVYDILHHEYHSEFCLKQYNPTSNILLKDKINLNTCDCIKMSKNMSINLTIDYIQSNHDLANNNIAY